MKKFQHLNERSSIHNQHAWSTNLLSRVLPPVFFENKFMNNFLKAIELILVSGYSKASLVRTYFKF